MRVKLNYRNYFSCLETYAKKNPSKIFELYSHILFLTYFQSIAKGQTRHIYYIHTHTT
jgi:hypothetical protein